MNLKSFAPPVIAIIYLKKLSNYTIQMNTSKKYYNILQINKTLDYTDIDILTQYITEQGKILPKRITGLSTKQQKKITKNIKRARILSLMPFINK